MKIPAHQEKNLADAGSRERTKRVVVPLPNNVIAVLTQVGEPDGRRHSGSLLFHLECSQEMERGNSEAAGL